MLNTGDIIGERYEVELLIARGGMGAVYRVKDLKLRNKVWAVKELLDVSAGPASFVDEVQLLAELSHPHIPKVVDYFAPNAEGKAYVVMDFIQGRNMQELYEESGGSLSLDKTLGYMIQLSEVLTFLHEQPLPIIFRDLKPANIMVDEHDHVKLVDFGIARNYKEGKLSDTIALGTIAFAAPEQLENRQTDHRSDLYSLGATMYYLLTGGKNFYQTNDRSILDTVVPVPGLGELLRKLLESNPAERFDSARSVKAALLQIHANLERQPEPAGDATVFLGISRTKTQAVQELSEERSVRASENQGYEKQATLNTPALIIYLLDISGSMSLEMDGRRRVDVVRDALSTAIKQMIFRSTKGSRISSRYRLAIIAYSDEVYDLLGGVMSIEQFAQTSKLPDLTPRKFTDTAKAFQYAEKLLERELPSLKDGPAPLICHMTDGAHTGEDPEPIVKRIMAMSVPDGSVLVENIFISDSILSEPIENVRSWRGIMPDTVMQHEVAEKLKRMSSPLPESYRDMMIESSYGIQQGALMMLPGTSAELVALGFQMSAATPVLK